MLYSVRYLTLLLLVIFWSCGETNDKIFPLERDLTESVYASVTVQPDSLYQAYAVVAGILEQNLVEEGDRINQGEPILQITNTAPELNVQNARLALDLARENFSGSAAILQGIRDEIVAAELKYKNDSINYFRQENLWRQQIGSKVEYDRRKLNYELSYNNLTRLRNQYDRTNNELETAMRQAQINYQTSLVATEDFTVTSKIDGKVYALYKEPGEIVTTMEPLAAVGSADNFIVEMLVDEVDIVRISKNQQVVLLLDAYDGDVFTGRVSRIYPKKDERNQTFTVEALFDDPPDVLYPGLSGEANIVIATREKVLSIPLDYLVGENQVKTDDGLITITRGLQNLEYVEVVSGLDADTPIYLPE